MNTEMLIATIDPNEIQDLLDEVGDKNYVRVIKHEFKKNNGRISYKEDDRGEGVQTSTVRGLAKYDSMRMLSGKKPIYLNEAFRRTGGELVSVSRNLRTNIGTDFVAATLGGAQLLMADWIALSSNTTAAVNTMSSSTVPWSSNQAANDAAPGVTTGEYTVLGVARKLATYAHTASTANYTQAATWTSSGTTTSLIIAGLFGGTAKTAFNASNAANALFVTSAFTSTTLATNDQLTLTWTINI